MPKIIPIQKLENPAELSALCREWDEPVFVTGDGCGDMVIMSMEHYETNLRRMELWSKIAEAEEDIRAGRVMPAEDALRAIEEKYGL